MTHKTVLIVEDDDDIRETLRDAFEDEGYVVSCAANGRQALEALRQLQRPCAVVLDIFMPIMNGNEVYAAMQADPVLSTVPVIVSTSDPSRAPSGALLMKKPIDLDIMIRTVEKLCQPRQK